MGINFSFAQEEDQFEPKLKYAVSNESSITAYINGVNGTDYDLVRGKIGDDKIKMKGINEDHSKFTFEKPSEFVSKQFSVNFVEFKEGGESGERKEEITETDSIDIISRPREFGIDVNVGVENQTYKLFVTSNKIDFKDFSVDIKVNGNGKEYNKIGDKLVVSDFDRGNYENLRVGIKLDGVYVLTKYISLDNDLSTKYQGFKREGNSLKFNFKGDFSNNTTKVFVNGNIVDSTNYSIRRRSLTLYVNFEKYFDENFVKISFEEKSQRSRNYYFDVDELLSPRIKKISKDRKTITINGSNFDLGSKKIFVNDKKFKLTGTTYGSWKAKITGQDKYQNIDELFGDEKDKKEEELQKELSKKEEYIFDADIRSDRLSFVKPEYMSGSINFHIQAGEKKSDSYEINIDDLGKREDSYITTEDNTTVRNVNVSFKNTDQKAGYEKNTSSHNLGKIKLNGTGGNTIINKINFDIKILSDIQNEMPIKNIKLGNKKGFIKEKDGTNMYEVLFKNIKLEEGEEQKNNISIQPAFGLKDFKMEIMPRNYNYTFLTRDRPTGEGKINYYNNQKLEYNTYYSPCFDINDEYENCTKAGYKRPSSYYYNISISESGGYTSTNNKSSSESEDTDESNDEEKSDNKNKDQDTNESSGDGNVSLTNEQKQKYQKLMEKIANIINNKTSNIEQKKKMYKKVYNTIKQARENISDEMKRLELKYVMFLAYKKYQKISK